jgi:opacity protein-like surface antigen
MMRGLLIAAMTFGAVSAVQAADMPDLPILRGAFTDGLTTTKVNWQGYYIGGQAGYGSSDENFTRSPSTAPLLKALLANTIIENEMGVSSWPINFGKVSRRSSGWGAFGGYNSQWEDVVIGVEASYLHGEFGGSYPVSVHRVQTLSDLYIHDVTSTSTSAISITDMATLRVRGGYAYGCFLPYMFGGFALGNADITRTATVLDVMTPGPTNPPGRRPAFWSATEAQHNHLIYGYSAGLGVDVNLIGGLFLRAEWEYIRYTASVDTNINTVRAGLGYKF